MSTNLTSGDVSMIARIIGRCYVGKSNRSVFRYLRGTFAVGAWARTPRVLRRKVMRAAFKCHADNRRLYTRVMGGSL